MKYPKMYDGESIRLDFDKEALHFACCDCGLVHRFEFRHVKGNIWDIVFFRDTQATGQRRRKMFGVKHKKLFPKVWEGLGGRKKRTAVITIQKRQQDHSVASLLPYQSNISIKAFNGFS